MEIKVVQRRKEWGDELQMYVVGKVQHLSRYYDGVISVDIIFDAEGERAICELVAHLARKKIVKAREESIEMHAAVDGAIDKLKRQLGRYKSQLREDTHHRGKRNAQPEMILEELSDTQRLRIRRTTPLWQKPMTPEEAALRLDSSPRNFIVFYDSERQKFSVIHRLKDGSYELIEPQY